MSPDRPHPFRQLQSEHRGWDRKHFDLHGLTWSLLVINTRAADCTGELTSMISVEDTNRKASLPWWSAHMHLSLPCKLNVDAAVDIIERTRVVYEKGVGQGGIDARRAVREALGLKINERGD